MYRSVLSFFLISLLTACTGNIQEMQPSPTANNTAVIPATSTSTPLPLDTPTPQPRPLPVRYGPDQFPPAYNPLTGQRVADPSLLDSPALLVSISHFPPIARPQAGFSFAPFVYEFFITEGATRHLTVFYGEFPEPEIPLHGDCEIRKDPLTQTKLILGNRVWYDEDHNGTQDPNEGGVGGICVNLYNMDGRLLERTTTDSNGYYGVNVDAGEYMIEFEKPAWLEFTQKNIGQENEDSDADQATGWTEAVDIPSSLRFWDAGLVLSPDIVAPPHASTQLPAAQVGPVRSGRLLYRHLGNSYQNSCLIYASADPDVLAEIPGCATVAHTAAGGGAMLSLKRMKEIALQNSVNFRKFNYTGNLYTDEPPDGGTPALELHEYWAYLNQSGWRYDAASGAWWRYVDESDPESAGMVHPEVDRLNGRQLMFENLILLFADHTVVTPTIVDINLRVGQLGKAYLFRDGRVYEIRWSTRASAYEQKSGLRRPIRFLNPDGTPAALKPGHTWVIIFTPQSYLEDLSSGAWRARFFAPEGAK